MQSKFKKISPKTNTIYRGDNLELMRAMPAEFVDLCYIDPPFFTQKDYKNIWGDKESVLDWESAKLDGFFDTKSFFEKHVHNGEKGLAAYLSWMGSRLVEIHRIMKPGAALWVHIDYHASHYLKIILDEIFGYNNFQNEIVWQRKTGSMVGDSARKFSTNTDTIFFYSKGKAKYKFNPQYIDEVPDSVKKMYSKDDGDGRLFRLAPLDAHDPHPTCMYSFKGVKPPKNGWRWNLERMTSEFKKGNVVLPKKEGGRLQRKLFLDERKGTMVSNLWTDISNLQGRDPERTGWPTQKPVSLLERIIKTSTDENDLVFDCFAGCGTTIHAAHKLKRKWVGIDISTTAMKENKKRLENLNAKVNIIDEKDLDLVEEPKNKKKA